MIINSMVSSERMSPAVNAGAQTTAGTLSKITTNKTVMQERVTKALHNNQPIEMLASATPMIGIDCAYFV